MEFEGDDATFLDLEPVDVGRTPRPLYWAQLVRRMGGNARAAEYVERMVGVKGKSRYREREVKRQFLTLNQVVLASGAPKSKARWELNEGEEKEEKEDEVKAETSIERLQRDILRMEVEIKEYGHEHLFDEDEDAAGDEDEDDETW